MLRSSPAVGDLHLLSWWPDTGAATAEAAASEAFQQISACLTDLGAIELGVRIFGERRIATEVLGVRHRAPVPQLTPTWVEGRPCTGAGLTGIHVLAVSSDQREAVTIEGACGPCARIIAGREAEYLYLNDVSADLPESTSNDAELEIAATLRSAKETLDAAGWSIRDVRRTWFYLRDILSWYDRFNQVRNQIFASFDLSLDDARSVIPASTGIEGRNLRDSWCTLDLLASRPLPGGSLQVERMLNPRQNEAPEYGSAFSRGLQVATAGARHLWISGTASIDNDGRTTHGGDFTKQLEETLQSVGALLNAAGAGLDDLCQATAFIKRPADVQAYHHTLERLGLADLPALCTIADVCRDDLLFELDACAIVAR